MQKILLASNNSGKLQEFNNILSKFGFSLISMADLNIKSPEETGLTFVENSIIKARYAAEVANLPVLADDSGLVVEALQGAPGIHSARYSGTRDEQANIDFLLHKLEDVENRKAYFFCCLVLLKSPLDPTPIIANGVWQGRIAHTNSGTSGFGYDPIFIPDSYYTQATNDSSQLVQVINQTKTAALLTSDEKNASSHRSKAIANLISQLENYY